MTSPVSAFIRQWAVVDRVTGTYSISRTRSSMSLNTRFGAGTRNWAIPSGQMTWSTDGGRGTKGFKNPANF